jgi:hypothetical protein
MGYCGPCPIPSHPRVRCRPSLAGERPVPMLGRAARWRLPSVTGARTRGARIELRGVVAQPLIILWPSRINGSFQTRGGILVVPAPVFLPSYTRRLLLLPV